LLDPAANILEALLVVDSIGQDDTSCTFVVGLGDVAEPLLPSSVPDLQFDFGLIRNDGLEFEVNSDSGDVALLEDSVTEFSEKVCFSYSAVADDDDFG
jgi:hypothetical protein